MKYLLVAVNASYSHTNIGVRSISYYVNRPDTDFVEFTINQPLGEILRGIYSLQPSVVMLSTYIWNAEMIGKIIPEVKKLLPECMICAGGPEFGFAPEVYLNKFSDLDFIMKGEGEETTLKVIQAFENKEPLSEVKGLYLRKENQIVFTGERDLICDLSVLPFPYPELKKTDFKLTKDSKIYYYESSRGCPYSCSYCMSSLDKRVRFMPLDRVFQDLQTFLDKKIPLVKFVDRTYNLNTQRYLGIWQYILDHHNGITMFHFEIEAEALSPQALDFIQKVPSGVMQFEIGVQSANKKTLQAVSRSTNIEKLAENVRKIPSTIHKHLDLIAGLPYEDLESFGKSFDFVMSLNPDALQLGFLKVLHGTQMEAYAKKNQWKWMENPVYETFSTPYLSYEDILFLKDVEVLVDAYYNSGVFPHVWNYIASSMNPWKFFSTLAVIARNKNVFAAARRETFWFQFLYETLCQETNLPVNQKILYDYLRYDFVLRGKQGGFPDWYIHNYDKNRHRDLLEQNGGVRNARLDFAYSEYEVFSFNVDAASVPVSLSPYEKLIFYNRG